MLVQKADDADRLKEKAQKERAKAEQKSRKDVENLKLDSIIF